MEPRIDNIAGKYPEAYRSLVAFSAAASKLGVPETTLIMVSLRASQINGCSFCVDMHWREMREAGEPDEKIFAVSAWRETPFFTDAERAALALTEAATRLSDRPDPVPDDIWDEAAQHYDEKGLSALVIAIAAINTWNRLNVTTRQPAGEASVAAAAASSARREAHPARSWRSGRRPAGAGAREPTGAPPLRRHRPRGASRRRVVQRAPLHANAPRPD